MAPTAIKKGYILIPVFYLILSISFLVLHFTENNTAVPAKDTIFVLDWEALSGFYGKEDTLGSAALQSGGLSFVFSKEYPLLLSDGSGNETEVLPISFSGGEKSISILFENEMILNLQADKNNEDIFSISFEMIPDRTASIIRIPVASDSPLSVQSIIPAVYYDSPAGTTIILPDSASVYDPETGHLVLAADKSSFQVIQLDKTIDPLVYWFTSDGYFTSRTEYDQAVKQFIDKTYAGLADYRWVENRVDWGIKPFEEQSLTVFMAENLKRGRLDEFSTRMEATYKTRQYYTGVSSAFFFGNIISQFDGTVRVINNKISDLAYRASRRDMSLFENEDLVIYMKSIHADKLNSNTAAFLDKLKDSYKPDLVSLTAILEIYLNLDKIKGLEKVNFNPFKTCIDSYLLPDITHESGTIQFRQNADSRLLIRTGLVLAGLGEKEGNELLASIGRDLIIQILSSADKSGILPEETGPSADSGNKIFPEFVYPLFSDRFYPKQTRKDNIQVYSLCGTEITKKGDSVVFEFSGIKNLSHNIVIEGLGSVSDVIIYGESSEPAPDFQYRETGGWFYDNDRDILYLKIRHNSEKETLSVFF